MTIHRLIRDGRKRLGMTEQQFADACGVSRGSVQQWEKEGGTAPNRAKQPRVAEVLGISVAELMAGGSNVSAASESRGTVPLVSEVQAGKYREVVDNFHPGDGMEMVPVTVPVKRHTFALRVVGDSMTNDTGESFPAGTIIVIEPDLEALPGDFVVAKNADDAATFKQLIRDGGDYYLKPLNPRYPIKPLEDATIIGVVREAIRRFR